MRVDEDYINSLGLEEDYHDPEFIKLISEYLESPNPNPKKEFSTIEEEKNIIISIALIPASVYAKCQFAVTEDESKLALKKFNHSLKHYVKTSKKWTISYKRKENWSTQFANVKVYFLKELKE